MVSRPDIQSVRPTCRRLVEETVDRHWASKKQMSGLSRLHRFDGAGYASDTGKYLWLCSTPGDINSGTQ